MRDGQHCAGDTAGGVTPCDPPAAGPLFSEVSCGGSEISLGCGEPLGKQLWRRAHMTLVSSADTEERRCAGAVAHRLALLLQRVRHGASPGPQRPERGVLSLCRASVGTFIHISF